MSEQRLWNWLRNRAFQRFKFRRQEPAGRYVLDFYCAELRLAIEVDGHHHETQWMSEYDSDRTAFLLSRGIAVVRIANDLLALDSGTVEQVIEHWIAQRALELDPSPGLRPPSPR